MPVSTGAISDTFHILFWKIAVLLAKESCQSASGRQKVQLNACVWSKGRDKLQAGTMVASKGLEESY